RIIHSKTLSSRFLWVQRCNDLFCFNTFHLDPLRETYGIPFYLECLAHWLESFVVAEAPGGELMGYTTGKAEAQWPGENGRRGLAAKLMELLEEISERKGGSLVFNH
uniref:N-acetyltransferase domain-containing protein n=1 Tax=Capra hircus TaxID=9925 RepID=A0A452EC88_CAPHI